MLSRLSFPIVKLVDKGDDKELVETATEILLWSFHAPDFSLFDGQVKPDLSGYRDDSQIMAAYAELKSRLGTDQIIWCYTRKDDFRETSRQMVEWALRVPLQNIVAFYDSVVWARIIGKTPCALPEDQRRQLRNDALRHFPNDPQRRRAYEDARTAEIWNKPAPDGGWWSKLFVDRPDRDGIDALISHPIDNSWLLGKTLRGFK
jgi:hypothetical protein